MELESIDTGNVSGVDYMVIEHSGEYSGVTINQDLPIALESIQEYMRIDDENESHIISRLVESAIEEAEKFTSLAIRENLYHIFYESYAKKIKLPVAPVQQIIKVYQVTETGKKELIQDTDFFITGVFDKWMNFNSYPAGSLEIIAKCGYSSIPVNLQTNILKIATTNYENREDIVIGTVQATLDNASMKSLAKYRRF